MKNKQAGFTLIEVVAVAALLGVLVTMVMPSLDGANTKVKNAKLRNDLATVDQAIQLYKMEKGSVPDSLDVLQTEYISGSSEFKDAKGEALTYTASDNTYVLSGKDASGILVTSGGSKSETE
ncbi:MAG: type II secretion system protein [Phascolarctobacterium sp.]|nr:type II secretion system protein [Phascolarctobacterium sp.]MBQ7760003.1 type II secretion system protein [Acidaminococcaceae bacterium]MBQ7882871.1 type II secretion system protein [Phascolarctobacterium sp.]